MAIYLDGSFSNTVTCITGIDGFSMVVLFEDVTSAYVLRGSAVNPHEKELTEEDLRRL